MASDWQAAFDLGDRAPAAAPGRIPAAPGSPLADARSEEAAGSYSGGRLRRLRERLAAILGGELGQRVVVAAADTYRAAAIEQLETWADRAGAEIVRGAPGGDPGAVVFDAIGAAEARDADVVIADTAGRLHTHSNLMAELAKVRRVTAKRLDGAPHETL